MREARCNISLDTRSFSLSENAAMLETKKLKPRLQFFCFCAMSRSTSHRDSFTKL